MKSHAWRFAAIIVATFGLGACGLQDQGVLNSSFWSMSPVSNTQNEEAELGLAELAKGNYVAAEGHFQKALRLNGKDVHALLGAGILYQNTGQVTKAREMYEAILAIRPKDSEQMVVWNNTQTRPISEIASVNLSMLESGAVVSDLTRGAPGKPMAQQTSTPAAVAGAPTSDPMLGRAAKPAGQVAAVSSMAPTTSGETVQKFSGGDANIVSRFTTLRSLRDRGLVTGEEFNARRQANLGALLPLTAPPPAAGLDRSVPDTEQIAGRLRAIGRALEMRALSVSQHASERSMILDALVPSAPVVVANPAPPPGGLMEAADSVRRLEQLRDAGLISSDEYVKERKAIEMAMAPPKSSAPATAAAGTAEPTAAEGKASGPQPGIHLASFRSRQQAEAGWNRIKKAHGALLGKLEHDVSQVNLGPKGTYFRLKAGPFADKNEASAMCRKLKARRQYCEPSMMSDG